MRSFKVYTKPVSKLLFLIFIIAGAENSSGQKISNVDFDDVKSKTQDSSSSQYYPLLLERFRNLDSTLTESDYKLIYYGNTLDSAYKPYWKSDNEKEFMKLYNQEKYQEAIPVGKKVLDENPVNLKILFKIGVSYNQLGDKQTAQRYARMYFNTLEVIYSSGDGKSIPTAYVVISVPDEYEILDDLELTITRQALIGSTDLLTINTKGQKRKKGETKIKELYFNVSKPLDFLLEEFKKKR
ncbi:MAG TPA: DUF4919 domain-containing protein [Chitinophagales bacterium]|nr:DUF4919 domain-containing protein [Chitinophagales bacterium]